MHVNNRTTFQNIIKMLQVFVLYFPGLDSCLTEQWSLLETMKCTFRFLMHKYPNDSMTETLKKTFLRIFLQIPSPTSCMHIFSFNSKFNEHFSASLCAFCSCWLECLLVGVGAFFFFCQVGSKPPRTNNFNGNLICRAGRNRPQFEAVMESFLGQETSDLGMTW